VEFENEGMKLVGMLHLPDGKGPSRCVVMLHGYTGDRIGEHFVFVKAARELARNGMAALRFDFRGSGESEGDFKDVSVETEISDALRAIEVVREMPEIDEKKVALLGHSLGGCVAACIAEQTDAVSVALWAPTAFADYLVEKDGETYKDPYIWLPENFRATVEKKGYVDMGGFRRGKAFFESIRFYDPLSAIAEYSGPVLLLHGSEDQTVSLINSQLLHENAKGRKLLVVVDGADHTFSTEHWEEQVIGATVRWFAETL
jgi:dipeptidyl aminopeptidase/acylaminoacyl peptidase